MTLTTLSVAGAVTPTVVKTYVSHYANRKPRHQKPTAHISYDAGLHLIGRFLEYASQKTVDEVQSFTAQPVPSPQWVRTENVTIPASCLSNAADALIANLGEDGIKLIGGKQWWQWRRNKTELQAEWIEMRSHYNELKQQKRKSRRIMLYVHGGGYFFGSVDEHRYQMQRHARKLKARVLAPRYRLAPQFPFPCGLQDCLAVYLYLLTIHHPSEILLAGDSAGGGMMLSILCLLRDQGIPLPAGAILISPWVDLTHSFPSVSAENPLDYIPPHGFHQQPSISWPPPTDDDTQTMKAQPRTPAQGTFVEKSSDVAAYSGETPSSSPTTSVEQEQRVPTPGQHLSIKLNNSLVTLTHQIQLYAPNMWLSHPLVSPSLQPSLGGLPPLLILTGGGEMLRDEQIYVAHKAAAPREYMLPDHYQARYDPDGSKLAKHSKPTPVQLQVWEDLCHVAPTLSFTRPAKFMYRSVAQFGAWALSRAQSRPIEILDDDNISFMSEDSESSSSSLADISKQKEKATDKSGGSIGKAGDALPAFQHHMLRQQVDRHGLIYPLPPASQLPATTMPRNEIGIIKPEPVRMWLEARQQWDKRYAKQAKRANDERKKLEKEKKYFWGEGERPPPTALAGRRLKKGELADPKKKLRKSRGLMMWTGWGSKHDYQAITKEEEIVGQQIDEVAEKAKANAEGTVPVVGASELDLGAVGTTPAINEPGASASPASRSRTASGSRARRRSDSKQDRIPSRSRNRTISVTDRGQAEGTDRMTLPSIASAAAFHPNNEQAVLTPPATADSSSANPSQTKEDNLLTPVFVPKYKSVSQIREESRDFSNPSNDAASVRTGYSILSLPDNASTMAVIGAAGISKNIDFGGTGTGTNSINEDTTGGGRPSTSMTDNTVTSAAPTTNATTLQNESYFPQSSNVPPSRERGIDRGGYDTPGSRRSLDRLQTTQTDTVSIMSGDTGGEAVKVASSMEGGEGAYTLQALRNPSSVAIVGAEGVVGRVEEGKGKEVEQEVEKNEGKDSEVDRPGLYNRESSRFQTAMERL